jgi:hypothetical protein
MERAFKYLDAIEEQVEADRHRMRQTGHGSSHVRLVPNRKNLLRIDLDKLWEVGRFPMILRQWPVTVVTVLGHISPISAIMNHHEVA